RPKARWRYTQYKGLLFFNFFDEVGVFHRCCGTTCFAFVLQFIELPFQLVDQFVNCGVHIFMLTTGNQNAVRCIDSGVSNEPLWLFGQNDMWINQMSLPFIQFGETVFDMLADCRSNFHLFPGNFHCCLKFYLLSSLLGDSCIPLLMSKCVILVTFFYHFLSMKSFCESSH